MIIFTRRNELFADLFILDDLTPFGIKIPAELFGCFKKSGEIKALNAEDLALELSDLIKENDANPLVLGGGGILTYALMSRFSYKRDPEFVKIKRFYKYSPGEKRPRIEFKVDGRIGSSKFCIDDIVASGSTINQIGDNLTCATLLTSLQCRGGYRKKEGSTINKVSKLFTAQGVNNKKGFPAIFSMRFIAMQTADQKDYVEYLSKYSETGTLLEIVKEIDKSPLELLYQDPIKFIKTYGG